MAIQLILVAHPAPAASLPVYSAAHTYPLLPSVQTYPLGPDYKATGK